jgi:alcohol dehydrogenase (cytochrome c)
MKHHRKVLLFLVAAANLYAQDTALTTGRNTFENRCSGCHGADGNGGELGPPITYRLRNLTDAQISNTVVHGVAGRMPAIQVGDTELANLVAFLRTLRPHRFGFRPHAGSATVTSGETLKGTILGEGFSDLQLRSDDHKIHLLRRTEGDRFREVTSQTDWPGYNGDPAGNRYTLLKQIDSTNVKSVAPRWVFTLQNVFPLEGTPVVMDGVMYVTSANECYALDAGSGRQIWRFQRDRTKGLHGIAAAGMNRGVALAGGRLFMVTDNAHLIALNRADGELLWETEMADWHLNYNGTSAPLAVGSLVISGTAGGEEGVRGFLAAYDQASGKEVWRFWTVPARGEPGSETWHGNGIEHGSAATWFTGTYDAETDTLFWPAGNPGEDYNGDHRVGDDLYSDCILALDPRTGKLKWHFQSTPHDLWDWDSAETPLSIDTNWQGHPRKLLVQGNRNGFFYVLDRTNGKVLLAKQFIRELTWAKGIGEDGRPIKIAGQEPSAKGTRVCPSQDGATNWYSPSYSPQTGLFYMQTLEQCSIYTKRPEEFAAGREFLGGAQRNDPSTKAERILRALDIQTGLVKWELPEAGSANSWGGTLATASGLVFFGEDSGDFAAADARTGKVLWTFPANAVWKASPMAYSFDNRELIAVAAGTNILVFGLSE